MPEVGAEEGAVPPELGAELLGAVVGGPPPSRIFLIASNLFFALPGEAGAGFRVTVSWPHPTIARDITAATMAKIIVREFGFFIRNYSIYRSDNAAELELSITSIIPLKQKFTPANISAGAKFVFQPIVARLWSAIELG